MYHISSQGFFTLFIPEELAPKNKEKLPLYVETVSNQLNTSGKFSLVRLSQRESKRSMVMEYAQVYENGFNDGDMY